MDYLTMGPANFDIDKDALMDISFYNNVTWGGGFTRIYLGVSPISNVEFALSSSFCCSTADSLPKNSVIDNNLLWLNPNPSSCVLRYEYYSSSYSANTGLFLGPRILYLGFRKILPNDTLYGWFLLRMNPTIQNSYGSNFEILSFAYEKNMVGIKENKMNRPIVKVYPNPVANKLLIETNQDINEIYLYSVEGRKITSLNAKEKEFDVSSISEGVYFLQIKFTEGVLNKKIVIQR